MKDTLAAPNPMPSLAPDVEASMTASIEQFGVLTPIIVSDGPAYPGQIVDGFNRTRIARKLGRAVPEIRVRFESEEEFRIAQIALNVERRQLTPIQRVEIGMTIEPLISELKRRARGPHGKDLISGSGFLAKLGHEIDLKGRDAEGRRTRAIVGELVGIDGKQYERIRTVLTTGTPELVAALRDQRITPGVALRLVSAPKALTTSDIVATSVTQRFGIMETATATYSAVVVDPPWRINKKAIEPGRLMAAELMQFPIGTVAAPTCTAFLWCPAAWLESAFGVMRAWQFNPVGVLAWKRTDAQHETFAGFEDVLDFCVVGSRGQPMYLGNGIPSLIKGPAGMSRLPPAFYQAIESCIDGQKISFFDKPSIASWSSWLPT